MNDQNNDLSMFDDEIEKRHKLRAWEVRRPKTRAEAESAIKLARGILANIDAAEPRVENGYHRLEIARVSWQQKLDELLYALECSATLSAEATPTPPTPSKETSSHVHASRFERYRDARPRVRR